MAKFVCEVVELDDGRQKVKASALGLTVPMLIAAVDAGLMIADQQIEDRACPCAGCATMRDHVAAARAELRALMGADPVTIEASAEACH
jgi:hypothetical protein